MVMDGRGRRGTGDGRCPVLIVALSSVTAMVPAPAAPSSQLLERCLIMPFVPSLVDPAGALITPAWMDVHFRSCE